MHTRSTELFGLVNMLGTAGMTWWVSATVLGATVIGVIWTKKDEIHAIEHRRRRLLFQLLSAFYGTILAFGALCVYASWAITRKLIEACSLIDSPDHCTAEDANITMQVLMSAFGLGTTSFIIYIVGWIIVYREIKSEENSSPRSKFL